jgi:hypothetical protein
MSGQCQGENEKLGNSHKVRSDKIDHHDFATLNTDKIGGGQYGAIPPMEEIYSIVW